MDVQERKEINLEQRGAEIIWFVSSMPFIHILYFYSELDMKSRVGFLGAFDHRYSKKYSYMINTGFVFVHTKGYVLDGSAIHLDCIMFSK